MRVRVWGRGMAYWSVKVFFFFFKQSGQHGGSVKK